MNSRSALAVVAALAVPSLAMAQFFEPAPPKPEGGEEAKPAVQGTGGSPSVTVQGGDSAAGDRIPLPSFDPGSEILSFDGKLWNITNNRAFRARFEKYLSSPESPEDEDAAYRKIIADIQLALSPNNKSGPNLPRAVALLPVASESPIDAHLCDALANAIYTVWISQKKVTEMVKTEAEQQKLINDAYWNLGVASNGNSGAGGGRQAQDGGQARSDSSVKNRYVVRIAELQAMRQASALKREITEIQAKFQYQSLMVSFFLQRRFEHVVIAARIYRVLFGAADQTLQLERGSTVQRAFSRGVGQSPTVSTLDAMANEFIRDVDEGVQSFRYQVTQRDLEGASQRLSEAFAVGEYLARIRTLPRTEKQQVLLFVRDANSLVSAMEVRDFERAGELVERLKSQARDFDPTKPDAKIREASIAAQLLIDKAKLASLQGASGDSIAADIEKAREIWPTNPALQEISAMFARGGGQATSLRELESLVAQQNYRAILADQTRFSAAVSGVPELESKLGEVLEKVRRLDMAVAQSDQFSASGNQLGAWEVLEKAAQSAPLDGEINRRRAALAGPAAALSSAIARAKQFEDSGELGPALTWYLRAQSLYPPGILAREGIESVSRKILEGPDSPVAGPPPPAPVPEAPRELP